MPATLIGVIVLAFAPSNIFKLYYFRMYLFIIILGFFNGLMFLPLLLRWIGPAPVNFYLFNFEFRIREILLNNWRMKKNYNKFRQRMLRENLNEETCTRISMNLVENNFKTYLHKYFKNNITQL